MTLPPELGQLFELTGLKARRHCCFHSFLNSWMTIRFNFLPGTPWRLRRKLLKLLRCSSKYAIPFELGQTLLVKVDCRFSLWCPATWMKSSLVGSGSWNSCSILLFRTVIFITRTECSYVNERQFDEELWSYLSVALIILFDVLASTPPKESFISSSSNWLA